MHKNNPNKNLEQCLILKIKYFLYVSFSIFIEVVIQPASRVQITHSKSFFHGYFLDISASTISVCVCVGKHFFVQLIIR